MEWQIKFIKEFWGWWVVTDGERSFKCGIENDAEWLCDLLNSQSRMSTERITPNS